MRCYEGIDLVNECLESLFVMIDILYITHIFSKEFVINDHYVSSHANFVVIYILISYHKLSIYCTRYLGCSLAMTNQLVAKSH